MISKKQLIRFTLSHSLFPQADLEHAIKTIGFVQIDPIKSPAPAQDLILRQRVKGYKKGDIEKAYEKLGLEEDFLYAHGFMTKDIWSYLHPRLETRLTELDKNVLTFVKSRKEATSKDLDAQFGVLRDRTWWGGSGRATNLSLQRLHYYGLIRIVRRNKGTRVYQVLEPTKNYLSREERLEKIILAMVQIMEPVSSKTLSGSMHRIHRHFGNTKQVIRKLIDTGVLEEQKVEGIMYLWKKGHFEEKEVPKVVRFLCPFDPLVRDRVRFEHLFGWLYQFEAYVPAAKRIRGYYAMPVLWGEEMVGWANVNVMERRVNVEVGYVDEKPKDKTFDEELEKEIERMERFLLLTN